MTNKLDHVLGHKSMRDSKQLIEILWVFYCYPCRSSWFTSWLITYHDVSARHTAMYIDVMYDNVTDVSNGYARTIRYLDVLPPTIYSLVWIHEKFFLQVDDHVLVKDDPQRFFLADTIAECAWNWVYGVIVVGICYYVEVAISSSHSIASEPKCAIS